MGTNILFGALVLALILLTVSLVPLGIWAGGSFELAYDSQRIVVMSLLAAAVIGSIMLTYFGPKLVRSIMTSDNRGEKELLISSPIPPASEAVSSPLSKDEYEASLKRSKRASLPKPIARPQSPQSEYGSLRLSQDGVSQGYQALPEAQFY